jgi:hypothetical protein
MAIDVSKENFPDSFKSSADRAEPDFNAWFSGSKVTGNNSEPLVVYHSSNADFSTDAFRPLSHFGTAVAAHDRSNHYKMKAVRVYPVFLSIKNPVLVGDPGSHDIDGYHDILEYLCEQGIVTPKEKDAWYNAQGETDDLVWERDLITLLSSKGYDGIKYGNAFEDVGSYSYIIFDADQVRSCYECPEVFKNASRYIAKYDILPSGSSMRGVEKFKLMFS